MARIKSSRITRLRRQYKPLAERVRLRLSDKTLRRLERERIHKGVKFEKVWREQRRERIKRSEQYIARIYDLPLFAAKALRKNAIKEHVSYKERVKIKHPPPPPEALFTNFLSFYDRALELIKKFPEAHISFKSGFHNFDGLLKDFSPADAKHDGDAYYTAVDPDRYWVLDDAAVEYDEQFDSDGNLVSLTVTVHEFSPDVELDENE